MAKVLEEDEESGKRVGKGSQDDDGDDDDEVDGAMEF